jgi:hypothetical protein
MKPIEPAASQANHDVTHDDLLYVTEGKRRFLFIFVITAPQLEGRTSAAAYLQLFHKCTYCFATAYPHSAIRSFFSSPKLFKDMIVETGSACLRVYMLYCTRGYGTPSQYTCTYPLYKRVCIME